MGSGKDNSNTNDTGNEDQKFGLEQFEALPEWLIEQLEAREARLPAIEIADIVHQLIADDEFLASFSYYYPTTDRESEFRLRDLLSITVRKIRPVDSINFLDIQLELFEVLVKNPEKLKKFFSETQAQFMRKSIRQALHDLAVQLGLKK
jgi:hypothetical protein